MNAARRPLTLASAQGEAVSRSRDDLEGTVGPLSEAAEHVRSVPIHAAAQDEVFVALQHLQCDIETALAAAEQQRKLVAVPAAGYPPPQRQGRLHPANPPQRHTPAPDIFGGGP